MLSRIPLQAALTNANVRAFLRAIREGESSQGDEAYRMENGGRIFAEYQVEHPSKGLKSPPGKAFGAPQYLASTWAGLVKQYGFTAMTPEQQDEGAVALVRERGALDDIIAGKFDAACALLTRAPSIWTSLPGGTEPNRATARIRDAYVKWGGKFEPVETIEAVELEQPQPAEEYNEATATSPVPEPTMPIPAIVAAILPSLLSAAPDLIRMFGSGGRTNERNAVVAERVAQVAMQVTGAVNEQEAAQKIQTDPAAALAFKQAVAENFDQWMGMTVKFHDMEEGSRAKAREFYTSIGREPVFFKFTFVELLSLILVTVASIGGAFVLWDPYDKFGADMKTAVIVLMFIGGFNGVKDFYFGSSLGSQKKDQIANLNQQQIERK